MKHIPLSAGKEAIVDNDDFTKLNQFKWSYSPNKGGYAIRTVVVRQGIYTSESMARRIMNPPKGYLVDHINGNTLDNRRSNLRLCTHAQNQMNQKRRSDNTSGFRGVLWSKQKGKWQARVHLDGKPHHFGFFESKEDAARAYDEGAKALHGEYARLNLAA